MIETKFNWNEVENIMDLLKNQDEQLSHINLEFQIREKQQKQSALLKIKR